MRKWAAILILSALPLQVPAQNPAACSEAQFCPLDPPEPVFGSSTILAGCWTSRELQGSAADKKIRRTAVNTKPPSRQMPKNFLPPLSPELQNSIRQVHPASGKKVAALTFDLCERANEITGYDYRVVNYLRQNKIKATFFASGKWMRDHPEQTMQLMADPLFELGNHAWTHDDLRIDQGIKMEDQILWTQAQYELLREQLQARPCVAKAGESELAKIPKLPLVFRFPYGVCSPEALAYLAQIGLPAIQWNIVTADPAQNRTAAAIAREVLKKISPGSIIIAHANGLGHGTSQSLPLFIPSLKKMGYEFVTVSELLTSGPALAAKDCYELKPGDNHGYDKIYGKQPK